MFSSTILKKKIKIYRFTYDQYYSHFRQFIMSADDIMTQTFLEDEVTLFKYVGRDDDVFKSISDVYDPREYTVINIHEDVPGIDHIGIVHHITRYFYQYEIPLLYINTFSYNLILISDEYIEKVMNILREISNVSLD